MPWKIESRCKAPNCAEKRITSRAYCERHLLEHTERENLRKQKYQELQRRQDAAAEERYQFYKSPRWRKLRKLHLASEPLCRECGAPARVVDHIERIAAGGDRYDQNNLQSMCDTCHNRKRSEEGRKNHYKIPTTLVFGPPLAGKSTYVREVAKDQDVIVDVDQLMLAISNGRHDAHTVERALLPFALEARDAITRRLGRQSQARAAWIISTSATDEEILSHKARGGEVRLIIPTLLELEHRISKSERASKPWQRTSWNQIVRDWYRQRSESTIPQIRGAILKSSPAMKAPEELGQDSQLPQGSPITEELHGEE